MQFQSAIPIAAKSWKNFMNCIPSLRFLPSYRLFSFFRSKPKRDAAVLAIIDSNKRILICKRAEDLKSYPGDACLPGGKQDDGDASLVDTALREGHEELGIHRSLITVQYALKPLSSMAGVWVHAVAGTVAEEPQLSINTDEVARVEWIPLELFLKKDLHFCFIYENYDIAHWFKFPNLLTSGLTAHLCILIAIKELGMRPEFDLNSVLTSNRMNKIPPEQILDSYFELYYMNVRSKLEK